MPSQNRAPRELRPPHSSSEKRLLSWAQAGPPPPVGFGAAEGRELRPRPKVEGDLEASTSVKSSAVNGRKNTGPKYPAKARGKPNAILLTLSPRQLSVAFAVNLWRSTVREREKDRRKGVQSRRRWSQLIPQQVEKNKKTFSKGT